MARPDYGRPLGTKLRQCAHRPLDVAVRDVAEHAAGENEIGRDGSLEAVSHARVAGHDLDPAQFQLRCSCTSLLDQFGIELDQSRPNPFSSRMVCEHRQKIRARATTEADDTNPGRLAVVEKQPNVSLDYR